jgi:diguanylate cyclase (GGDEF)-like protein/PAS domain S-box-containing protein
MHKLLHSLYLYPLIAVFFIFIGIFGFYQYSISNAKETILNDYKKNAKENSLLLKSVIEELSLNKKEILIQREINRIATREYVKHVLLISPDKTILYANRYHYVGKKLKDIFNHKTNTHYENEIKEMPHVHIHTFQQNSIDITMKINYLYNNLQKSVQNGYLIMLYDLNHPILNKKNELKYEFFAIFITVSIVILLFFYLYYINFLKKIRIIEDIVSSFNEDKKDNSKSSICIDTVVNQLIKTTIKLKLMSMVLKQSNDAILITDENKKIISVNPAFEKMSGYTKSEIIGKKPESFMKSGLMDDEYYQTMWKKLNKYGTFQGQIIDRKKDGRSYTIWQSIWSLTDPKTGKITNYVSMSQDITEIIQQQKQIEYLAYYDGLTNLANRSHFLNALEETIKRNERKKEQFALIYTDLDNFKEINDTLGHASGDIVLKKFAKFLKENLRSEDTISRLGGDEFAIIALDIHKPEDTIEIAQKIIEFSKVPFSINNRNLDVGVSVGIALYPDDGEDSKTLLSAADIAMYRSKEKGKNRCTIFQKEMQEEANKKTKIQYELKKAIKNDELILY